MLTQLHSTNLSQPLLPKAQSFLLAVSCGIKRTKFWWIIHV